MESVKKVVPDVVSYTTLIQGYREVNDLTMVWELFEACNRRDKPGMDVDE